uniref:PSI-K n=1 Tax=Araucaria cunninghamii TaxID=56994 RepID=A0A0D6R518_ARACU
MAGSLASSSCQVRSYSGLRPSRPAVAIKAALPRAQRRAALQTRCDGFLGSQVNLIFVVSTTLFLTAGRFGLAPTVKKRATAGLQLYDTDNAGLITGDPAGFTAVDVLAHGTMGHVIATGIVLGLRSLGQI